MKWIVLVGAPAVGKSTLSQELSAGLNAKVYSFDKEFPLNKLQQRDCDSKNCRRRLIEMILTDCDESDWIIVDDTCHLKSMQKRYIAGTVNNIKVIFLYISAKVDQIPDLQKRNSIRNSDVTSEEIDRMVRSLILDPPNLNFVNVIEYNYAELPKIGDLITHIHSSFDNYCTKRDTPINERDSVSDENILNQINLALNKEISSAFKGNRFLLDGKTVSTAKKAYLTAIRNRKGHLNTESIVNEFKAKFLCE